MGSVTILNDTNAPINSCISAGVNYSWVNGLLPKEYYIHNGAAGIYTLNTRFWLGEPSEYSNSATEIGLYVASTILGIVGLVLSIPTGGASLSLTGAAAAAVGGAGTAIGGISIAATDFFNQPESWTNIHAIHDRKFIASGHVDLELVGKDIVKWKNKPLIVLRELSDAEYQQRISTAGGFHKHHGDIARDISADFLTREDLEKAGLARNVGDDVWESPPLRICPALGDDVCWEIENDDLRDGQPMQLWSRPASEAKIRWVIRSEKQRDNALDVFLIYNPALKRYAQVTEDGRIVSGAARTSASEFHMIATKGDYAFADPRGRIIYPEGGWRGNSTKLRAIARGVEGDPDVARWSLHRV